MIDYVIISLFHQENVNVSFQSKKVTFINSKKMSEAPKTEFSSANECYSHFTKKRLQFYDAKHTPTLEELTNSISEENRLECIKRIVATSNAVESSDETLFFAIRLFDLVLTKLKTENNLVKQKTIAATCILIAAKYNDPPKLQSILEEIINVFQIEELQDKDIIQEETDVLMAVSSDIFCAIPSDFYTVIKQGTGKALTKDQENVMNALFLTSILSMECSSYKAEQILAAAITVSCKLTKTKDVTNDFIGFEADEKCVEAVEKSFHMALPDELCQRFNGLREFIDNALM